MVDDDDDDDDDDELMVTSNNRDISEDSSKTYVIETPNVPMLSSMTRCFSYSVALRRMAAVFQRVGSA